MGRVQWEGDEYRMFHVMHLTFDVAAPAIHSQGRIFGLLVYWTQKRESKQALLLERPDQ